MIQEKQKTDISKKTADARNERAARRAILEDLFQDFHKSRMQVYWFNFFRGIFFGLGTALGGTLVVALIIWLLGVMAIWVPGIGQFIREIISAIQSGR